VALQMFSINPSAPSLVIFWERTCEPCKESLKILRNVHPSLRVYGVHVPIGEEDRAETTKVWARNAPKRGALLFDREEMLKSSFGVKGTPKSVLILPKQKFMFSYLGNIKHNKKDLIQLIKTEL
ncbi:MAG: thioredoxin fold domain-containing protein, partial [Bdellovibrionales bacterium]|nr:thioredoxin fold domain-containing protein [Bdellovibrionales bacterium]